MWLVAAGLLAIVVYLGRQSPGPAATSLPPDNSTPATGTSPVLSPAMTGANPYINGTNLVTLGTSARMIDNSRMAYSKTPRGNMWAMRQRSLVGGNYMTDADSQLMTQNVPPLVQTVSANTTSSGQKL